VPVDAARIAIDAPAPVPREPGADFIAEARLLARAVACSDGPLPAELAGDRDVIERHCAVLRPAIARYRAAYFGGARAWFAAHVPADAPRAIVYPFAGGDLLSALVAFPDATEITTLSLELAGDPRTLTGLAPADLERELATFRRESGVLIVVGSNTSKNLSAQQTNALPGEVCSFLLGLVAGGYEPVAMRYFILDERGQLHYVEAAEIAGDTTATHSLRGLWQRPAFAGSFRNVEIRFTKPGDPTVRVHRHIAWNLDDATLARDPAVLRHLEAKGQVTVLVKGGSYLLWLADFSQLRDYLVSHLAWMLSDSTGILPAAAARAGLVQEPYGRFDGPVVTQVDGSAEDTAMRALWQHPVGPMPFRFGYLDKLGNRHVLITRRASR
jgi:hypothetical protein